MQTQITVKPFQSDKELLRTLLNCFGSVIVFVFYSQTNQPSKQFLKNFNNSVGIFGSYPNVKYFSLEAGKCPETFGKFSVQTTPTVIITQTDKKILKKYESPEDIGSIFDDLAIQVQKYVEQYQNDKKVWYPKIQSILSSCPVIIFIKGTPQNPKCGFTRTLLQILKDHKVQFTYYDIIQDQYMRYWLRAYKDWPTYPQIYINGQLMGGLDIVKEIVQKGQFAEKIPGSCKTDNPELKYQLKVKENEVIAFMNAFSFENKDTEAFLKKLKEKYENLYVCNVSLDASLSDYIKNTIKQELPFVVVKGEVQAKQ